MVASSLPPPNALSYRFDLSGWPIVFCPSLHNADGRPVNPATFYAQADAVLARGERCAFVMDMSGTTPLDPSRRRRFAEFMERQRGSVRELVACMAIVLDSRVLQGMVTAVTWMVEPPIPVKVFFDDEAAARAWARAQLDAPGGGPGGLERDAT